MAYLTDEISEGATKRRLDEITTGGLHALDERAQRSAQIDEEFRQAQAKMKEQAKAMDQLVADSRAKAEAEASKDEQPTGPNLWAREAKPTTLSFFAEEHAEESPAPAAQPAPSAPPGTAGRTTAGSGSAHRTSGGATRRKGAVAGLRGGRARAAAATRAVTTAHRSPGTATAGAARGRRRSVERELDALSRTCAVELLIRGCP